MINMILNEVALFVNAGVSTLRSLWSVVNYTYFIFSKIESTEKPNFSNN